VNKSDVQDFFKLTDGRVAFNARNLYVVPESVGRPIGWGKAATREVFAGKTNRIHGKEHVMSCGSELMKTFAVVPYVLRDRVLLYRDNLCRAGGSRTFPIAFNSPFERSQLTKHYRSEASGNEGLLPSPIFSLGMALEVRNEHGYENCNDAANGLNPCWRFTAKSRRRDEDEHANSSEEPERKQYCAGNCAIPIDHFHGVHPFRSVERVKA
jgi:hypothetical protein